MFTVKMFRKRQTAGTAFYRFQCFPMRFFIRFAKLFPVFFEPVFPAPSPADWSKAELGHTKTRENADSSAPVGNECRGVLHWLFPADRSIPNETDFPSGVNKTIELCFLIYDSFLSPSFDVVR